MSSGGGRSDSPAATDAGESVESAGEAPGDERTEAQAVETTTEELTREPIDDPEDNEAF